MVVHAFKNIIDMGIDPSVVNDNLHSSLLNQIKNVSFDGASGNDISIDSYGDRIQQYQVLSFHLGSNVVLGLADGEKTPFTNRNEAGVQMFWPSGKNQIPVDTPAIISISVITPTSKIFFVALALFGALHSSFYIPWVIINWHTAVMTASTQIVMIFILIG